MAGKRFSYTRKKGKVKGGIIPFIVEGKGLKRTVVMGPGSFELGRRDWKNQRKRKKNERRSFDPNERIIITGLTGRKTNTRRMPDFLKRKLLPKEKKGLIKKIIEKAKGE